MIEEAFFKAPPATESLLPNCLLPRRDAIGVVSLDNQNDAIGVELIDSSKPPLAGKCLNQNEFI